MCAYAVNKNPLKVLVIGAGVAGLTAAKQLQSFGSEAIVLEARVRLLSIGMSIFRKFEGMIRQLWSVKWCRGHP